MAATRSEMNEERNGQANRVPQKRRPRRDWRDVCRRVLSGNVPARDCVGIGCIRVGSRGAGENR